VLTLGASWRSQPHHPRVKPAAPPAGAGRNPGRSPGRKPAVPDVGKLVTLARPLVMQGLGRREIARQLGVSEHYIRLALDRIEAGEKPALHLAGRPS
jgi:hypothetical protein